MTRKKLEKFSEGVLEYVSKIIGNYKTGSELTELLSIAGYPHIKHDGSTKWRFVYDVFKDLNSKPDGQYHVAKIIQTFCDPTQWIGRDDLRKRIINTLNKALIHVNLQLNKEGKLVITNRKTKIRIAEEERREMPKQGKSLTVSPIFTARDITREEDLCFVLMPFNPSFDRIYREQIKPSAEALGFKCIRADDIFSPTPILEDIWIHILKSKVIIADVTGRNPNVFYEIGIAHTVGRPVIIITQDKSDVPFDIAHYRYFVYSDDEQGWNSLRKNISLALEDIKE